MMVFEYEGPPPSADRARHFPRYQCYVVKRVALTADNCFEADTRVNVSKFQVVWDDCGYSYLTWIERVGMEHR